MSGLTEDSSRHHGSHEASNHSGPAGGARAWAICLLLTLITLAVYWPVGGHDFVDYDDGDYVVANPRVQAGLSWEGVKWAFRSGHASNWHPLTWLSHMADVSLFGKKAGGHHLTSVGLHCLNTVLLVLLLRRLTGTLWPGVFVAAFHALHPLHVESVAWVSERKDVLSAFFGLMSLWVYAKHVQVTEVHASPFTLRASPFYWLSLFCFAVGLMSKPMLVTWPFLMLLLDYWPLRRFEWPPTIRQAIRMLAEKLPFFALSLASCVVTFIVQQKGGAVSASLSLPARLANALVSYARYLRKTVWPDDLSVLYPHPGAWPGWQVTAAGALVVALSAAALRWGRRWPFLPVGWFWFLGLLVPVIGVVQVGIQSMADRYTYVPAIGLFILAAWTAAAIVDRWPRTKPFFVVAGMAATLSCAVVSRRQVGFWANSETLFRRTVAVTEKNYLAHNNLGYYLSKKGRVPEAMECYRRSLEINRAYADAHNNLGHALAEQRNFAEAIHHYRVALELSPHNAEVLNNLGNALSETGDGDGAVALYEKALRFKPDHADAHNNLGIALAMRGRFDEALVHFKAALRSKPEDAGTHSNLGNLLAAQRRFEEAVTNYNEALRLSPGDAQAHNNLANVLTELGRLNEAVGHYEDALRLKADNPEAHFNLGCTLAQLGKRTEAIQHLRSALALRPDYSAAAEQLRRLDADQRQ